MEVRDLTSDELTACRNKATQKVDKLLSDSENETVKVKFDKLFLLFEIAADRWDHFGEHFKRNDQGVLEFLPKDDTHVKRDEGEVVILLQGKTCYEETMKAAITAMDNLQDENNGKLSRVNGTSLIFNQCSARLAAGPKQFVVPIRSDITLPQMMAVLYK